MANMQNSFENDYINTNAQIDMIKKIGIHTQNKSNMRRTLTKLNK